VSLLPKVLHISFGLLNKHESVATYQKHAIDGSCQWLGLQTDDVAMDFEDPAVGFDGEVGVLSCIEEISPPTTV
jgi:hypothetical protein